MNSSTRHLVRSRRHHLAAAMATAAAVALAACSADAEPKVEERPEPVETDAAVSRLVVSYPDHVAVLDAVTLEVEGTFKTDSAPYVQVGADGRHVFTLAHQDERVRLVDSGTWTEAHGDHGHYYAADPVWGAYDVDGLSYHVVSDDERSVVWLDDAGEFQVIDADHLADPTIEPTVITVAEPHHGVAVPTADGGFLATVAVDGDANGVAVLDATGAETARFETCPGLHGETHVGETAYAFGCGTGVMVVDTGQAVNIASPIDGAGTGTLASSHDSAVVVGDLRSEDENADLATKVALYDTANGTSRAVDVAAPYSNIVVGEGHAFVIGTDGSVRSIDLATGGVAVVASLDAWDKTDDWMEPRPYLAASGHELWVTDPHGSAIHRIDSETGEVTSTDVEGEPGRIVVVNAPTHTH